MMTCMIKIFQESVGMKETNWSRRMTLADFLTSNHLPLHALLLGQRSCHREIEYLVLVLPPEAHVWNMNNCTSQGEPTHARLEVPTLKAFTTFVKSIPSAVDGGLFLRLVLGSSESESITMTPSSLPARRRLACFPSLDDELAAALRGCSTRFRILDGEMLCL